MKKIFLALVFYIPILVNGQAVTNGLIGHWSLNGNANDLSGNDNNGVVHGANLSTDRFGNAGYAYSFDGVDDFIEIQDDDLFSFGNGVSDSPFTISFWMKPEFNGTHQGLISKWDYSLNKVEYVVYIRGLNKVAIAIRGNDKSIIVQAENILSENKWQHVVLTYNGEDANGINFWINGVSSLVSIAVDDDEYTSMENTTQNLWIGNFIGGADFYYHGEMDDISLYNRALTAEEIHTLYISSEFRIGNMIYCAENGVGIDTETIPGDYKFAVNGKSIMEGVQIATQDNWPDYVFDENYDLTQLTQLEEFIFQNNHLPDMPDAVSVKKDGYDVGEMNSKLLKKIEELTLYILEQNKKILELEERLDKVENK